MYDAFRPKYWGRQTFPLLKTGEDGETPDILRGVTFTRPYSF